MDSFAAAALPMTDWVSNTQPFSGAWLSFTGVSANGLLAEMDWVQLIIICGATLGVAAVGVYLILYVKDWMQTPQEYSTTGDDLESLREALKLGSIDEEEYRRAVNALKTMNERLAPKEVGSLQSDLVEQRLTAASFVEVEDSSQSEDSTGNTQDTESRPD